MQAALTNQMKDLDFKEVIRKLKDELKEYGLALPQDLGIKAGLSIVGQDHNLNFDKFTERIAKAIEKKWDGIERSLLVTAELMKEFGIDDAKRLKKKEAAFIPVATFIAAGGFCTHTKTLRGEPILSSPKYSKLREAIKTFIHTTQIMDDYWGKNNAQNYSNL